MEELLKRVKAAAKHANWVGTDLKGQQIVDVIDLCEMVEKHIADDHTADSQHKESE